LIRNADGGEKRGEELKKPQMVLLEDGSEHLPNSDVTGAQDHALNL